ncbi:MAG TPA: SusC/RagA family TonB-linked outer membrane protein, partial [Flavihumibacter sp.]|nr:SusC/RagA family TonB-linked outer membrane protein [Flavihumibacter sp.]
GFEAALNATLVEKRDFDWNLAMNATFIKNTVSGLPSPIFTGFLEGNGVSGVVVETIQNGLPMNAFYTRHFLEMDKATGQAVYQDDGNTLYYVGNPNPNTLLGLSTSLRYKKLSMVINMNGVFGQKIFNSTFLNVINVGSINA